MPWVPTTTPPGWANPTSSASPAPRPSTRTALGLLVYVGRVKDGEGCRVMDSTDDNYGETPIQEDQVLFNFLAPAVNEHHATLGLSYRPSDNIEWTANYMHAFKNTVKGPTALGPTAGLPVKGENGAIDMYINSLGISFAYKM